MEGSATGNEGADYHVVKSPSPNRPLTPTDTNGTTEKKEVNAVPLTKLFSYADGLDKLLMVIGTLGACATGAAEPLRIVLFGDVLNAFNPTSTDEGVDITGPISTVSLRFALAGIAALITGFLQVACWSITASRQAKRIRSAYVNAILTKDIGWFDVNDPMQLATRASESSFTIQQGMGRKIGDALNLFAMGVTGVVIGFAKGWELSLLLLAFTPFIAAIAYFSMKVMGQTTQRSIDAYGQAGAIAQESLSNVRTVHMFNSINYFTNKYDKALEISEKAGIKKAIAAGFGTALIFFATYCSYSGGFYYGAVKVADDNLGDTVCEGSGCYDGGKVITIFFAVIFGAKALGQSGPSAQALMSARAAAYDVFKVIDMPSKIDSASEAGKTLDKVDGSLEIDNVSFAYPSRPNIKVCENYSLSIKAGETVALVGPSGSGKSTVVSLVERFYDPLSGSVRLDGEDIRQLNVKWLRKQVGLVGQEPSLFATTIMENIRYGAPEASDEDVREAAKMANAYDFIMTFPQAFDTEVGERGAQLSGGQKQRIAIARAIIKNPPILLLDEATSALDTESERIVQESLDKLVKTSKRTTIIVAHRLSTIRDADKIAVHSKGSIIELGSHDELMKIEEGHYRRLVESHSSSGSDRKSDKERGSVEQLPVSRQSSFEPKRSLSRTSEKDDFARKEHHDSSKMQQYAQEEDENGQLGDKDLAPVSTSRIWNMSTPEWEFMVIGVIGAIVNACTYPVWGFLFTKVSVLLFTIGTTREEMLEEAQLWAIGFVCLGVAFGLSTVLQQYGFGVVAERLTRRVRVSTYSSMLHQEIGWFDQAQNSSGALVSRLATDSAILQAVTSDSLNATLVKFIAMGAALVIAFFYSWQMTLVLLACTPLFMLSSYLQALYMSKSNESTNDAENEAGALLSEAIGSVRTVASFGMEKPLRTSYDGYLDRAKEVDKKGGISGGAARGFSECSLFLVLALLFYVAGIWVSNGTISFEDMFMVLMVIMLSSFAAGTASQSATDSNTAKRAAARVFNIIDRKPLIDATDATGRKLDRVHGELQFRHLKFAYPARPDAVIYNDYSLNIKPGDTVALVGASGSGKSTAISLLERFYDPDAGVVTLDSVDLKDLCLPWLRDHISLVSQEPVLFSGTIAENIAMGKPEATREDVMEAAKKSNAHNFICNFPNGYDTDVGDNGAQVSGGQKQRIAIARAILRDPEVLLLDEATSALDNESQQIVQASLDRLLAIKRRTTIIVAHRLSTIRNADLIAVTKDGAIVEQGTHEELMEIEEGVYKSLVSRQMNAS